MKLFEALSLIEAKKIEGIKRIRNLGTENEEEIKIYHNKSLDKLVKEINGTLADGGSSLRISGPDAKRNWETFNTYSNIEFDVITIIYSRKDSRLSVVYQDPNKKFSLQQLYMENQLDPNAMDIAIGYNLFPSTNLASSVIFDARTIPPENAPADKWIESITKEE